MAEWGTGAIGTWVPQAPARRKRRVAWHARKLVFFAGHVPKPYIRPTRYLLWRQGRRDPRVTTVSSTLSCQVGAFAKCDLPTDFLKAQNNTFWLTHCHDRCGTTSKCMASKRSS